MPEQIPNDIALRVLLVFLGLLAFGFAVALASLSRSYGRAYRAMLDTERAWARVESNLGTTLRHLDAVRGAPSASALGLVAEDSIGAALDAAARARQSSLRARGALRDEMQ